MSSRVRSKGTCKSSSMWGHQWAQSVSGLHWALSVCCSRHALVADSGGLAKILRRATQGCCQWGCLHFCIIFQCTSSCFYSWLCSLTFQLGCMQFLLLHFFSPSKTACSFTLGRLGLPAGPGQVCPGPDQPGRSQGLGRVRAEEHASLSRSR